MRKFVKTFANFNIAAGIFMFIIPVVYLVIFVPLQPTVVASNGTPALESEILTNKLSNRNIFGDVVKKPKLTVASKTDKQYIKIDSIGLDTEIYEGTDQSTLDKGVWIEPEHTTPDDRASGQPVVLAAHRWGPDDATYEYRSKNLFYNLPNVDYGDVIKIIWNGVEYDYQVVGKSQDIYVDRLSDLILITCIDYHSSVRMFVFANRIN